MENPVVEEIPTETVINPNVDNWLMSTKGRDKNEMIYQLLTLGDPYLALILPILVSALKRLPTTCSSKD